MRVITILASLVLLSPSIALAALKTVHVEWEYGGIATTFRLYLDGLKVCETPDYSTLDCQVDLKIGDNQFTMTAVGPYGETPHSAPFNLVYNGETPVLIIKSVGILR